MTNWIEWNYRDENESFESFESFERSYRQDEIENMTNEITDKNKPKIWME